MKETLQFSKLTDGAINKMASAHRIIKDLGV